LLGGGDLEADAAVHLRLGRCPAGVIDRRFVVVKADELRAPITTGAALSAAPRSPTKRPINSWSLASSIVWTVVGISQIS
jgi:hypothetical protein